MNYPLYLDYCATTPCHPEVVEEMLPWFTSHYGNSASKHHVYGWMAEHAVETAREKVADLIGARPKEIIFTSGATEAINLAIKGTFDNITDKKLQIRSAPTEHKAVLDTLHSLQKRGAHINYLPVDEFGNIKCVDLDSSREFENTLLCLMHANNETGTIHPLEQILSKIPKHITVFSDAVQTAGKIPIPIENIHLLAMSAHKMYGPKGIGALYIKHNHPFKKPIAQIDGGGHEKGFRSGTLNVPAIVGFGKAAEIRKKEMEGEAKRLRILRDMLEKNMLNLPDVYLNGDKENRLPHVLNLSFDGIEGETLLQKINQKIAVSSGSACSSISTKPSHVLLAMGINPALAKATVRFSLGSQTKHEDIEYTIQYMTQVIHELR